MFRREVVADKGGSILGDVSIAVPISWAMISYLFFGGLVAAFLFFSFASYNRIEIATGIIVPDRGLSRIIPSRAGTINEIAVKEGQAVEAGDLLAIIRTEEDSGQSFSSAQQIEQAIARQQKSLTLQIEAAGAVSAAQQSQLAAQQQGLRSEIAQILSQISIQQQLVEKARVELERAQSIAVGGFISQRDLQVREESLLVRQQQLSQLNQNLSSKQAALAESERLSAQTAAQARATDANLAASSARIGQLAVTAASSRSYAIRAPVAGTISVLSARIGQPAMPANPLMTIVPAGSELQAELAVPSSAIGFVKVGQEVRLAIDAFPYLRYGTVKGRVQAVAASAITHQDADGEVVSAYPVRVQLGARSITAFGRSEPLVAGMTLSARIVTGKHSLFEWLFEPFYAVKER